MVFIGHVFKFLEQDFPVELFGWLGYIFIPYITAILQGYIAFIHELFSVPLYFWNRLALICFTILKVTDDSFLVQPILVINGTVNERVKFHDGYGGTSQLD
jgi:hypothetical protein